MDDLVLGKMSEETVILLSSWLLALGTIRDFVLSEC